jgi:hypothetical protein
MQYKPAQVFGVRTFHEGMAQPGLSPLLCGLAWTTSPDSEIKTTNVVFLPGGQRLCPLDSTGHEPSVTRGLS